MLWSDGRFRRSVYVAAFLLLVSALANFYAGTYATQNASAPVTDIILSNTPTLNVDLIFVYGSFLLAGFITLLCLKRPKRMPFVMYSVALFTLIRAAFISLTHIGPFPSRATLDLGSVSSKFIFGGDLFFSAHTGIPFLMALLFWHEKPIRYVFLVWSLVFGTIALLGHLHYTIDVMSAFFITYTIYHIALWLFPKDAALFCSQG